MNLFWFVDGWFIFCFFFNDFYFLMGLIFLSCFLFWKKNELSVGFYFILKIGYLFYVFLSVLSFWFFLFFFKIDFFFFFSNPIFFISTLTAYFFNGFIKINVGFLFLKLFFSVIFLIFFFLLAERFSYYQFKVLLLMCWGFFLLFFLTSVNHLFLLFLTIEFLSIITILLVVLNGTARAVYLAILYFFLNIFFSTAFMLSYTYFLIQNGNGFLDLFLFSGKNNLACFFLFLFFLFKLGAAPFHAWSLDIYEHLSLSVFVFLTVFYKLILFIIFFKILFLLFYPFFFFSSNYFFLFFAAILCIIFGIFSPLGESRILRVFTFSSLYVFGFCLLLWLVTFNEFVFFFFFLIYFLIFFFL